MREQEKINEIVETHSMMYYKKNIANKMYNVKDYFTDGAAFMFTAIMEAAEKLKPNLSDELTKIIIAKKEKVEVPNYYMSLNNKVFKVFVDFYQHDKQSSKFMNASSTIFNFSLFSGGNIKIVEDINDCDINFFLQWMDPAIHKSSSELKEYKKNDLEIILIKDTTITERINGVFVTQIFNDDDEKEVMLSFGSSIKIVK